MKHKYVPKTFVLIFYALDIAATLAVMIMCAKNWLIFTLCVILLIVYIIDFYTYYRSLNATDSGDNNE